MAHRDYKQTGTRRAPAKKKGGLLKIVLIGLVLGLGMAAVVLWFMWPRAQDFRKAVAVPTIEPPPKAATPPAEPATKGTGTAQPAQDYTFYDILPGNRPPKPLPVDKNRVQWWLQVAALKNASDADALRAKLSLLNFTAVVQPTPAGEPLLYRVRVGPYPDQVSAETAQKNLSENKIDSRALKEAVTP